ncbi:MAG: lytic transglycosylase domain-containing protein [Rhodospirillales bacterium]|jgi:soluble lytic murein transglycosylase|nr:lytic transglycosylase domain-containing protein [Rhodospirillales bacterium]
MLSRFGACFLGLCLCISAWGPDAGRAFASDRLDVASLNVSSDLPGETPLPKILSADDIERYRKIFAVQAKGHWKTADKLITGLSDRVLMGHVMAQRYLHPTKYRSKYKELKDWMAEYADHPDAQRIYKLALRRRPKNWKHPKKPVVGSGSQIVPYQAKKQAQPPRKRMTKVQRRKQSALYRQIKRSAGQGWTLAAKRQLESPAVKKLFDAYTYDRARAVLGARYFIDGRDEWALKWAGAAAKRSGKYIPEAHWSAGLAAWRMGKLDAACEHFSAVALSPNSSPWLLSAGAFWAARSYLMNGQPTEVNRFFGIAAAYPRTFYGLLAQRILGLEPSFRWTLPPLEESVIAGLAETSAGRRSLALGEVDREAHAERELRLLATRSTIPLARGIMALASRAGMPGLSVRLNDALFPQGGGFDGAAYPIPKWTPDSGFKVDRALIYALIRQESKFNPKAKSWAGASGLMQLMPRTASFVARDRRLHSSGRSKLFVPGFNLELGQKYIEMLLKEAHVGGDLFLLTMAWNGGPGNLNKWQRNNAKGKDALLFIESIPSRETRIFVERVLTNLWIYRDRLGQASPSLDAVAAGDRPFYIPLDSKSTAARSSQKGS